MHQFFIALILALWGHERFVSGLVPIKPLMLFNRNLPFSNSLKNSFNVHFAVAAENEEIILDFDDDDDDFVEDTRTYTDFYESFMKIQSSKKRSPDVGDKAQALFDEMYEAHIMSEDPSLWPNTTIYNILLDTYAWSYAEDGAEKAQHILDRMEDMTVESIARPNVLSYMHVMDAWANRNAPIQAEAIMTRMKNRFELTHNQDICPDTKAFNKLIGAWMKSDRADSAEKAEMILQSMIDDYETNGNQMVLPNQKSFVNVMRCYGKYKSNTGLQKVRELFDSLSRLHRMTGNTELQPDTQVYNELINTIAQNKEMSDHSQQAEAVLYEMLEAVKMGHDVLQPNAATFRHVIYGYKGVTDPGVSYKIEKLLELARNSGVEINASLYSSAIQVIAWSRDVEKGALCWKLLQRMKSEGMLPLTSTYNSVLNACSHTSETADHKDTFSIAVEAFNALRAEKYQKPDVTSYGYFLRCCSQLLPENSKRDLVVKNVFAKCCQDGQVGRYVVTELMRAGSEELIEELLGNKQGDAIQIPRKWSQNVKDTRQLFR